MLTIWCVYVAFCVERYVGQVILSGTLHTSFSFDLRN